MLLGVNKNNVQADPLKIPVETYANRLLQYFENYFNNILWESPVLSDCGLKKKLKIDEKAKVRLRSLVFPNNKEFAKDFDKIRDHCGVKTNRLVAQYTQWIMQTLGKLAECMIVDHCCEDRDFNIKCINIALLRSCISYEYPDIAYDDFMAFSPSFKFVLLQDPSGIYIKHQLAPHLYNPHHTTMDISWLRKDNYLEQLKLPIPELNYLDNAKLQIKVSLHCDKLDLKQYEMTPVLCFDLGGEFPKLKERYPQQVILSGGELFPEMQLELENYFKILGAYACELTDHINLTDLEIQENMELAQLFRSSVEELTGSEKALLDRAGLIQLAQKFKRPIVFAT